MAWFLNKSTGLKWNIEGIELIERLLKDENYEVIEEAPVKKTASAKSKTTVEK